MTTFVLFFGLLFNTHTIQFLKPVKIPCNHRMHTTVCPV